MKTLAFICCFFFINFASAQNDAARLDTTGKNLDEIFVKSKVDLLKLLLRFTSKNFSEQMPDSTFRYNFQFSFSTETNEGEQPIDSASGCFYIDSRRGRYKYLSTLDFGEITHTEFSRAEKTKWGFSLPDIFYNNPLEDEKSLALQRTEKGSYVKLNSDGVSKIFLCYNKWKFNPGYENLMYPHLSYIYYFDSLNRLDSSTVFTLDQTDKLSADTSLFRTYITYHYAKNNPRIITKAICQISSIENGKTLATQRLIIDAVPIKQPINFAMTNENKPISVFRNIREACLQFDHLKVVTD